MNHPLRTAAQRPLLRHMLRPVAAFAAVVALGVAGFSSLAGVGVVDALFWLLDPTSIELHFRAHEGPETLAKGYAVVIEQDDAEYRRAVDDGFLAIQGDARREGTLTDAGVKRAATVVGAIDDSNANIQIAMGASQIAPTVRLVVRVGDEMYESLARRAGADEVIIPEIASARQVTTNL